MIVRGKRQGLDPSSRKLRRIGSKKFVMDALRDSCDIRGDEIKIMQGG